MIQTCCYMVIIVFPGGNMPGIHIIPELDITGEMLERMEAEVGDFPSWCTPGLDTEPDSDGEYADPQSVCNIDKIGVCLNPAEKNYEPYTITRVFSYIVG